MPERFDDAVVGAGILGLAHAYHLARRGRRVIVFERSPRAAGASVRNFGMLWPIGQPAGRLHRLAMRSREVWLEVLEASGLWHERSGSLHLAYREDEARVLREFAAAAPERGFAVELLEPREALARAPLLVPEGLILGLFSPSEVCVDPREVIAGLPGWLERAHGVRFAFSTAVTGYRRPAVAAGGRNWEAERLFVCSGDDVETLYPEVFRGSGVARCKLQMMRSRPLPGGARLGPLLAGGLTLRHYPAFEACPGLAALRERVAHETPLFDRYGIHVMASQNGRGEVVIGDSHQYGEDIEPFDKPLIDRLVLDYLAGFLRAPGLEIEARWHGIYLKHPREHCLVAAPEPGVRVATGAGGAGMTLSFGLAEEVVEGSLAEEE